MFKLIKLEWQKNKVSKYIRNALILILCLGIFIFAQEFLGIARDPSTGVPDSAPGNMNISSTIELLTGVSFLIFSSVMYATFVITAYKNKTINLMFSYPISRKKILVSKILAVWIFCFIFLVAAKLFIYAEVLVGANFFKPDFGIDFNFMSLNFYIQIILKSIVTITIALMTLVVGLITKSSKAEVVSSILLFFLLEGNIGDFTLSNNMLFPIAIIVGSIFLISLTIINIETKDVV